MWATRNGSDVEARWAWVGNGVVSGGWSERARGCTVLGSVDVL